MGKESTLGKDGRIDHQQILSHLFLNHLLKFPNLPLIHKYLTSKPPRCFPFSFFLP